MVLELNRLCIAGGIENAGSILVSGALRMIPHPAIIVSYADTAWGHIGYVYQATNWIYTGMTDAGRKTPRSDRIVTEGRHGRHEARIDGGDKVDTSVGKLVYRKPKHRYVYLLGTKYQRREMRAALRYPVLSYPKGETKRHEADAEIQIQRTMF